MTIRVPYPASADAGDRVQIFSDFGTGTIDLSKPMLAAPVPLFDGQEKRFEGFGTRPIDHGIFSSQLPSPGRHATLGDTDFLAVPLGTTPDFLQIEVMVPAAYGLWKFAAKIVDREGNIQTAAAAETTAMVAGTEPPDVSSIALSTFDKPSNKLTFDLVLNAE